MPPPYVNPHWNIFSAIPHMSAGAIGEPPAQWAVRNNLGNLPVGLPTHQLTRRDVRTICQNAANNVLFGYVCAMAWGGQTRGHPARAWGHRAQITNTLLQLRAGGLTRRDAYRLFLGAGNIPGLGPAYFTKLIYFFSPDPNFYIMDQFTSKSVNLLTGYPVVRIYNNAVAVTNRPGNYQAYCEEIDAMAAARGIAGDDLEEMLMSGTGRLWRIHLNAAYPGLVLPRYSATWMHGAYPHISIADL